MRIYHRIDDIHLYSDKIKEILDFFDANTSEFILAVIPSDLDSKLAELYKSYSNCRIFQHGFEHINHVRLGWCDEFPDSISYKEKFEKIKSGREKIEKIFDISVNGYVPPWNNTGAETIEILKKQGFEIYSAQENNTVPFISNLDVSIDIVDNYKPKIVYKNLELIYNNIKTLSETKSEIGIMYHFSDISQYEWQNVKKFIIKTEQLNNQGDE